MCIPTHASSAVLCHVERLKAMDALISGRLVLPQGEAVRVQYSQWSNPIKAEVQALEHAPGYLLLFDYDNGGRLIRWELDSEDDAADVVERFVYDREGQLIRWEHDAAGVTRDLVERFSYDAQGRISLNIQRCQVWGDSSYRGLAEIKQEKRFSLLTWLRAMIASS